jgi:hypothetical protein
MANRSGVTSRAVLAMAAMIAAAAAWSCGGASQGPTAPLAVQALQSGEEDGGGVTSSCNSKVTVCHKGKDLSVSSSALGGHLGHGDRLGSCSPAVACPCFSASGLAAVAASCTGSLNATCEQPYSLGLYCAPGGTGGTIGNLGLFEARLGTNTCSTTMNDPMSGSNVTNELTVTPAQFEACRQAIVGNPVYPSSCPR